MSLEQEIADWAASRPAWQRSVLGKLAAGQALDGADFEVLARQLADGRQEPPPAALVAADLPGAAESGQCTRLIAVKPVAHVNALLAGEQLTFGTDGLTVVYGDNASGKSGYARLIKKMVRARHQEDVLTNISKTTRTRLRPPLFHSIPAARDATSHGPGRRAARSGKSPSTTRRVVLPTSPPNPT